MSDSDKDSLRQRAEQLQREAEASYQKSEPSEPPIVRWFKSLGGRFPFLAWLLSLFLPLIKLVALVLRSIRRWFAWAAYIKGKDGPVLNAKGRRVFSPAQFLKRTLISVLVVVALHVSLRAAYFYGTQFSEVVYVTGKQEIVTGELYQFGGCTSLPCSTVTDNGKFYLIETSLYFPRLYYPEENVFANIPQQNAACKVEGYGFYFRSLRWLYKSAQLYQHVYDVTCRPYTDAELDKAMGEGVQ